MRRFTMIPVVALAIFVVVGCKNKSSSLGELDRPKVPRIAPDTALRPLFRNRNGLQVAAGTAFVVQDRTGNLYMLTAAHVMINQADWQQTRDVSLRMMGGPVVAQVQGRPAYIGSPLNEGGASFDLVVWQLAGGARVTPLKLASADPMRNEWLWVVGQESRSAGAAKAYLCQVAGTANGGRSLRVHDHFEMAGFSGGPLINAKGEVVGCVLGRQGSDIVLVSTVGSIRARLAEAGIDMK